MLSFCTKKIFLELIRFVSSIGQALPAPLHVEQTQWLKGHPAMWPIVFFLFESAWWSEQLFATLFVFNSPPSCHRCYF